MEAMLKKENHKSVLCHCETDGEGVHKCAGIWFPYWMTITVWKYWNVSAETGEAVTQSNSLTLSFIFCISSFILNVGWCRMESVKISVQERDSYKEDKIISSYQDF